MNLPKRFPESASKVFSGVIYDIYQWQQNMFDGTTRTFECAKRQYVVTVIAVIGDKIVVLNEEQPGMRKRVNFIGGGINDSEDPYTAAIREIHEETGMTFKNVKLVSIEDIGGPKLDWWAYRFVATELVSEEEPHPGAGEKIEVTLLPFDQVKQMSDDNIFMSYRLMKRVNSLHDITDLPEVDSTKTIELRSQN